MGRQWGRRVPCFPRVQASLLTPSPPRARAITLTHSRLSITGVPHGQLRAISQSRASTGVTGGRGRGSGDKMPGTPAMWPSTNVAKRGPFEQLIGGNACGVVNGKRKPLTGKGGTHGEFIPFMPVKTLLLYKYSSLSSSQ